MYMYGAYLLSVMQSRRVREAVKEVCERDQLMHHRGYEISQTRLLLLDYFTATTYSQMNRMDLENGSSLPLATCTQIQNYLPLI